MMRPLGKIRRMLGVLTLDVPRYLPRLWSANARYLSICNRNEMLDPDPRGDGYRCTWQWSSDLHAPKLLPPLGRALMRRALRDHPIGHASRPSAEGPPRVSFVIGHRGTARLSLLLATIESIASQTDVPVECIVVEQDMESHLAGRLPPWVRHVHTPLPEPSLRYCRSWAFNVGVRHATSPVLVLHDNDILVPTGYAAAVLRLQTRGFDVLNLKRFVFYLGEAATARLLEARAEIGDSLPVAVGQNLLGGSLAITREAYDAIGGFDEAFIGWGGEDVEFWERARSRRAWEYGFLPFIHLWHEAQPGKNVSDSDTLRLYHSLALVPVQDRIAALVSRASGMMSGPAH
jgi:hypothetical protein